MTASTETPENPSANSLAGMLNNLAAIADPATRARELTALLEALDGLGDRARTMRHQAIAEVLHRPAPGTDTRPSNAEAARLCGVSVSTAKTVRAAMKIARNATAGRRADTTTHPQGPTE